MEVNGEVEENQGQPHMDDMWMKVKDSRDDLSQNVGCDVSVTKKTRHLTACRRAQTSRMLCLCLLVYVVSQLSTLVLKVYLSSYTFAKPFCS